MQPATRRELSESLDLPALEGLLGNVVALHGVSVRLLDGQGLALLEASGVPGPLCHCQDGVAVSEQGSRLICCSGAVLRGSPLPGGGRVLVGPEVDGADRAGVLGLVVRMVMVLGGERHEWSLQTQARMLERNRELEARNRMLEQMHARLRELDRMKGTFLATMSHELRTPLTAVIGYAEMLGTGLAGELTAEQKDYVSIIREKGDALLSLISSVLDIGMIQAGRVKLAVHPMPLSELLRTSANSLRPQAQKKGVVLELQPLERDVMVPVDRVKLRQVLVNLLNNAVKFTPAGGRVTVSTVLGPEGYAVTVEDTGPGIPLEHQPRIFEAFYQADGSTTREHGGVGIGLAVVKAFTEAHGGRVDLDSEPGRGTRFTVRVPFKPEAPAVAEAG
jgi:two-component system sensor histidine kinase BarA